MITAHKVTATFEVVCPTCGEGCSGSIRLHPPTTPFGYTDKPGTDNPEGMAFTVQGNCPCGAMFMCSVPLVYFAHYKKEAYGPDQFIDTADKQNVPG